MQPSLLDIPVPRRHRKTRETSIAAYAVGREKFTGRKADVLRWLAHWFNLKQSSPTSGELANWVVVYAETRPMDATQRRLHVRRGLSDFCALGTVEVVPDGKRKCEVTKITCETWRVRQR